MVASQRRAVDLVAGLIESTPIASEASDLTAWVESVGAEGGGPARVGDGSAERPWYLWGVCAYHLTRGY